MKAEKNQKSLTKNEHSITKINGAGMGWRLFAGIVDGLIFAFTWLCLTLFVFTPIANAAFKYEDKMSLGSQYQVASHLYVYEQTNDDGEYVGIEVKDLTEKFNPERKSRAHALYECSYDDPSIYIKRIYYYFHNYKTAVDIELPNNTADKTYDAFNDYFVDPEYNEQIEGKSRVEYYSDSWFLENIMETAKEDALFKYDPSIDGEFYQKIVLKDEGQKSEGIKFVKNAAYNAASDFYSSKYYVDLNAQIKRIQVFIVLPPYVLGFGAFFFLVPLLSKDGQTLGKLMNKIAVISKDGYRAKKRQILFRELILFFLISFSLIVLGVGLTSLATCGVMIVILLAATLISKSHRAPHDYAAMTQVVDMKTSVYFNDFEDEERHRKEIDENMAKYKSVKVENKNIIQIGGEILDENLKKEIEEERKKSDQK